MIYLWVGFNSDQTLSFTVDFELWSIHFTNGTLKRFFQVIPDITKDHATHFRKRTLFYASIHKVITKQILINAYNCVYDMLFSHNLRDLITGVVF